MAYSKKIIGFGLLVAGFAFRIGTAQAIPVPTIGGELATQIDQLTKHIQELKEVKDQIQNGVEQAKAMGDKMSLDALKNAANGTVSAAMAGGMGGIEIPQEMSKVGFTEDMSKDPEKIVKWVNDIKDKGKEDGEYNFDVRKACLAAQKKMKDDLETSGFADSIALQQNLASGKDLKKAEEVASSSDDQMQLLGANTAMLKAAYQQAAASTKMEAIKLASEAIKSMCN